MTSIPHSPPELPLDRPGVMIAALPAVLGFVPEKSIVLLTFADDDMGAVLRADLSESLHSRIPRLAEVAANSGAESVVAVIVDDGGADCLTCVGDHRASVRLLAAELGRRGVGLQDAHLVDVIAAGGRWRCLDECGAAGHVEDPNASAFAAAAVLDGRRLYGRRDELEHLVAITDGRHTAALERVIDTLAPMDARRPASRARDDIKHALACAEQLAGGTGLSDEQTARLAVSLVDTRVRDTLYALAVGDRAGVAEALWADLSRRLPTPWRVEALVLLAFSAYARGDGPLAGIALDAALDCQPGHRMAGMLDQALGSGLRPEQIRDLARTGYRLAAQLGVQLPPRLSFGRRAG
jgi:hypothetical protein